MMAPFRFPVLGWLLLGGIMLMPASARSQTENRSARSVETLQRHIDAAVTSTLEQFAARKLESNQLAVTVIELQGGVRASEASYRGDVAIYPASVIKLFYLVAAHRWLEDGRLKDSPELRRALRDMVVDSSNDATHYVLDVLTETTSGPEMPEPELDRWFEKRNAVNRYFTSLGYTNINASRKPWCEGPYGREWQSMQRHTPRRNALTTRATAGLLAEIAQGRAVTHPRSLQMLDLMKREPAARIEQGAEPGQGNAFIGLALRHRPGARLWSKAGWTSETRHDAAYVELPKGARFVLVIFTTGHAQEREIIGGLAERVCSGFEQ